MTVLITGAGLIGTHLSKSLIDKEEILIVLDISPQLEAIGTVLDLNKIKIIYHDILDFEFIVKIVKDNEVKCIIHTTANPLLNVGAQEDPLNSIKINTIGTANILEASRKLDVNKVIFISSATLYTNKREINEYGKLSEENVTKKTNIYND